MSPKTLEAYAARRRPVPRVSWPNIWADAPSLEALAKLSPADVRAFMAARRSDGSGGRSLMRVLAGARSFARFLERNGKGKVGALAAVRAPKIGKTLPKPLAIAAAKADLGHGSARGRNPRAVDPRPRRRRARSALRLGTAHLGSAQPQAQGLPSAGDAITVNGKGNKTRMVPVLPQVAKLIADYVALCPIDLPEEAPLFVGARGGPLAPRIVQLAMERLARRARPARHGDAARLAPFLRHASAGARRRPACDPGTARPRLAIDNANLHRRRYRAIARSLSPAPIRARDAIVAIHIQ